MPPTTSAPIKRGIVQTLRASAPFAAAVEGIYEGFAPENLDSDATFAVYQLAAAPYEDDWTNRLIIAAFDVFIFSRDSVGANNVDQLAANALDGAAVVVDGQTTLICHRVADAPMPPDLDAEGKKVYQVGGSYELWTDQSR
jgi:hypothetical protein